MVQTPFSGNRLFTKKAIVAVLLGHVVTQCEKSPANLHTVNDVMLLLSRKIMKKKKMSIV